MAALWAVSRRTRRGRSLNDPEIGAAFHGERHGCAMAKGGGAGWRPKACSSGASSFSPVPVARVVALHVRAAPSDARPRRNDV
jgi:hypothetical protein